jgi:Carboxypeptidase regulatory-like domain
LNLKAGIRVSAALAITACGLLLVPALASAATGSIAGTVTAASGGAALKGIEVCADQVGGEEEPCILTSASGEYTISGLTPGSYKVEFWPHREGLNFITQFYDDQPTFAAAEEVTVTAGATHAEINAELSEGGRITGTVTDAASHAGVGEIIVCAFGSISEEGGCALTAAGGQYTIAGLPSGSYEVVFAPNFEGEEELPGSYITQYYNDEPTFSQANLVSVTAPGGTTSGIDAALAKRALPKIPTISVPPVIAPTPPPAPVAKPLTCKKGFQRKTVAGKARCVKKTKHHHRYRHHR